MLIVYQMSSSVGNNNSPFQAGYNGDINSLYQFLATTTEETSPIHFYMDRFVAGALASQNKLKIDSAIKFYSRYVGQSWRLNDHYRTMLIEIGQNSIPFTRNLYTLLCSMIHCDSFNILHDLLEGAILAKDFRQVQILDKAIGDTGLVVDRNIAEAIGFSFSEQIYYYFLNRIIHSNNGYWFYIGLIRSGDTKLALRFQHALQANHLHNVIIYGDFNFFKSCYDLYMLQKDNNDAQYTKQLEESCISNKVEILEYLLQHPPSTITAVESQDNFSYLIKRVFSDSYSASVLSCLLKYNKHQISVELNRSALDFFPQTLLAFKDENISLDNRDGYFCFSKDCLEKLIAEGIPPSRLKHLYGFQSFETSFLLLLKNVSAYIDMLFSDINVSNIVLDYVYLAQ